jgi:hypothetical protein
LFTIVVAAEMMMMMMMKKMEKQKQKQMMILSSLPYLRLICFNRNGVTQLPLSTAVFASVHSPWPTIVSAIGAPLSLWGESCLAF